MELNGVLGHDSALVLGWGQHGLMRWILLWIIPLVQDVWRKINGISTKSQTNDMIAGKRKDNIGFIVLHSEMTAGYDWQIPTSPSDPCD